MPSDNVVLTSQDMPCSNDGSGAPAFEPRVSLRENKKSDTLINCEKTNPAALTPLRRQDLPPDWSGIIPVTAVTRCAAMVNSPVFTWCSRSTHSDVICIMNTVRGGRLGGQAEMGKGGKGRRRCKLPYSGGPSSNFKKIKGAPCNTPLSQELSAKARLRLNKSLHEEREEFMKRLSLERDGRLNSELTAATHIQALFRGFTKRPGDGDIKRPKNKEPRENRDTDYVAMLQDLDELLGLASIPGVTLTPPRIEAKKKKRLEKKRQEEQAASVVKLQSHLRGTAGREATRMRRQIRMERYHNDCAYKIQHIWHNHSVELKRRARKEKSASTSIQNAFRRMNTNKQLDKWKELTVTAKREADAVVRMQSLIRMQQTRATFRK